MFACLGKRRERLKALAPASLGVVHNPPVTILDQTRALVPILTQRVMAGGYAECREPLLQKLQVSRMGHCVHGA